MPEPTNNTAVAAGQAAQAAPVAGQVAAPNTTNNQPTNQQPAQAQAAEIKPDEIARVSQFELSPTEKIARLERDYSASSTEARRLKSANDALTKTLSEQGLKPIFDSKGNFKGLEADEKYEGKTPDIKLSYKGLAKEIREKLADDPESAFEEIAALVREQVSRTLVRAKPTVDPSSKIESVSPERIDAEIKFLADRRMPDSDVSRYEFNNQTLNVVKSLAQSLAEANPAFARFLAEDPSTAIQLAADRIAHSTARHSLVAQKAQQQKQEATARAKEVSSTSPSGTGNATVSTGKDAATEQYSQGYDKIIAKGTLV